MENWIFEIFKRIIQLAATGLLGVTLISFFGRYPYLELFTHFRFQYLWIAAICFILLLFLNSKIPAVFALVCFLVNGFYILPFYFSVKTQAVTPVSQKFSVISANVAHKNENYAKLLESVRASAPDVLILQEFTSEWDENTKDLQKDYPYFKTEPRTGGAGLAVFSRYPLESAEVLQLDDSTHPAIFCKINLEGKILSLLTIHPLTPMRADKFASRNKQLSEAAKLMRETPAPKILIGDMNITPWSPYYSDLVKESGLKDVRMGRGLQTTWISFFPAPFRIPIDHCLVSRDIAIESLELGEENGSDHFPIVLKFKVES